MLKDVVNRQVVCVEPDTKVAEVARIMSERNVGSVLVCDENKPKGILTDRDIVIRCIAQNVDVNDCTVEQVVSEPIEAVKETDGIYDVIRKMKNQGVRRVPVVDKKGDVIGIISFDDLIVLLGKEMADLSETANAALQNVGAKQLKAA